MRKMNYNKKAEIGVTLTWFSAFIIIFFIMVIFLSATILISANKKASFGSDVINIKEKNNVFENQKILLDFLEKEIIFDNGKPKIKNVIIKGFSNSDERTKTRDKLKEEMDKISKEIYGEKACYVLDVKYPEKSLEVSEKNFDVCSFTCADERFSDYVNKYKMTLLNKAFLFNLYSEKGIIGINFYIGEC